MAQARPHITVDDLRIGWGPRVLMEHINFRVERGTIFAILGGSGSGKSTLARDVLYTNLQHLLAEQRKHRSVELFGLSKSATSSGSPPGALFGFCAPMLLASTVPFTLGES